jgi:hypothetical protein
MANANPSRMGGKPKKTKQDIQAELDAAAEAPELGDGPRIGEMGEYLPATYTLPSGNIRRDR